MRFQLILFAVLLATSLAPSRALADPPEPKVRVLIVDGMNNHDWPRSTRILKAILEKTDRFSVDVSTSPPTTQPAEAWDHWRPRFSDYACVVTNFNGGYKPEAGVHWPHDLEKSFEDYV